MSELLILTQAIHMLCTGIFLYLVGSLIWKIFSDLKRWERDYKIHIRLQEVERQIAEGLAKVEQT